MRRAHKEDAPCVRDKAFVAAVGFEADEKGLLDDEPAKGVPYEIDRHIW